MRDVLIGSFPLRENDEVHHVHNMESGSNRHNMIIQNGGIQHLTKSYVTTKNLV